MSPAAALRVSATAGPAPASAPNATARHAETVGEGGQRGPRVRQAPFATAVLRTATAADAAAIYDLVTEYRGEGHLLPRSRDEIRVHAHRFIVAEAGDGIVGCVDLAPLSRTVAEVRSLVVAAAARRAGVGRELIDDVVRRAGGAGFDKLCAFTHTPSYFVELGFSIVPHVWLPEKIQADCRSCAEFRRCGQYAVMLPLVRSHQSCVPLASLHG